jgi:GTP-binding protein HflX
MRARTPCSENTLKIYKIGLINIETNHGKTEATGPRGKAVLVGLSAESMDVSERPTEVTMEELEALLETAGGISCAVVLQNRMAPEPRTFIGSGKVREVSELIRANQCDLAVFDNELSPSQMRALSEELGVLVLDRSGLILDIFAGRAKSAEGRLQVELAQYKYLLPRLVGMWSHLARQTASGGGSPIGTRGPGETQLETDRRHIRRKISKLEQELSDVSRVRSTQRRLRQKNGVQTVALVGYTNAGKSTLLNALTNSAIQTGDRLFDTLDTTTRRFRPDDTTEVLLSDTVGFIRKLPHHLIEAFKATLEELGYADMLLHVIDASNPDWMEQAAVVDRLIEELGARNTPRLEVFNKCDLAPGLPPRGEDTVFVSAKTGEGLDHLKKAILRVIGKGSRQIRLRLPYDQGDFSKRFIRTARCFRPNIPKRE